MRHVFLILSILSIGISHAQNDGLNTPYHITQNNQNYESRFVMHNIRRRTNRHNIYFEALGTGGFGSINYEWGFIERRKWRLSLRTGFSFAPIESNNETELIFPILVHLVLGNSPHKLDVGIGQTLYTTTHGNTSLRAPLSIGYRLNPRNSRIFYRLSYTPIISYVEDGWLKHWGGISIGLKLK